MNVVFDRKAIATADIIAGPTRYHLTVTRRNDSTTARFALDRFATVGADAEPLAWLARGTWLDFVAALPAEEDLPSADIANAVLACFQQVMAM